MTKSYRNTGIKFQAKSFVFKVAISSEILGYDKITFPDEYFSTEDSSIKKVKEEKNRRKK